MKINYLSPTTDHIILMLIAFLSAFVVTYILIPAIIRISERKNIFDVPDERKVHTRLISRLGGVGIFIGFLVSSVLWFFHNDPFQITLILSALFILFVVGLVDDLKGLTPLIKYFGQLLAAFIAAYAGLRIHSLAGIFGINELPMVVQYGFTMFLVTGVINAVNLIDGIDGLAGGLTFISVIVLTSLLIFQGDMNFALIGLSLSGALMAFLKYNLHPAKIFMGDTGSILLGFSLAILGIQALTNFKQATFGLDYSSAVILVYGSLLVPVYDTLRVFAGRVIKKQSPFSPDKTHIHHLIIQSGYNHARAARILYGAHLTLIITAIILCHQDTGLVIFLLVAEAVLLTELLTIRKIVSSLFTRKKTRREITDIKVKNRFIVEHYNRKN
jgi:UDP-N-acetylmuramyl pentapeptide phosphotransferase/UDP-N-acetylglucosamine-1-phosphate transferase